MEIFRGAVDNLVYNIRTTGEVVDLQPLFFRLSLDVTTAFLFGESVQSLKTPEAAKEQLFATSFSVAQDFLAKRFRFPAFYFLIGGKKFRDACKIVHNFADQIIDRNLSRPQHGAEDKFDFLHSLASNTPDRTAIRSQIINILVAGRDTTACLLSWTLYASFRRSLLVQPVSP